MEVMWMYEEDRSEDRGSQQQAQPIPLEAVRDEFSRHLREQGIDPETVPFKVEQQQNIGRFDGEARTITTTVLTLPDGSSCQWFPELPDGYRERRRQRREPGID
jgi:hypothetical protein